MDVYIDLPEETDHVEWASLHADEKVPDVIPYGLDKLTSHGIRVQCRPPLRDRSLVWFAQKVRGRIGGADVVAAAASAARRDRWKADAVLCWDERNGVPAALVPGGPPVVSGTGLLLVPSQVPPVLRRLSRVAFARMAAMFQPWPSTEVVEDAWDLPRGSIRYVPFGVDERFFRPEARPDEPPLVLGVGDDRRRDHSQLVRAIDRVVARGVRTRLEIVTTLDVDVPPHLGLVHRLRLGGEIRRMYQRATLVAITMVPGHGGGLTTAVEAMACGRPVVATALRDMDAYIEHGRTGLLVPPGDDEALADAIASLVEDPAAAEAMGRAGRAAVEQSFTSAHTAADLARMLRSL